MARKIARAEGMFVGYTSGAVMQGVTQLAEEGEFDSNSKVVAIFPDHGSRYMSKVFSDEWMKEQGFTNYPGLNDEQNKSNFKKAHITNIN
jgi:cystathionine beta-synthase